MWILILIGIVAYGILTQSMDSFPAAVLVLLGMIFVGSYRE